MVSGAVSNAIATPTDVLKVILGYLMQKKIVGKYEVSF